MNKEIKELKKQDNLYIRLYSIFIISRSDIDNEFNTLDKFYLLHNKASVVFDILEKYRKNKVVLIPIKDFIDNILNLEGIETTTNNEKEFKTIFACDGFNGLLEINYKLEYL